MNIENVMISILKNLITGERLHLANDMRTAALN